MRAPTPSFKPRSKQLGNNRERDAEETLEMAVPGTKGQQIDEQFRFERDDLYGKSEMIDRTCATLSCVNRA